MIFNVFNTVSKTMTNVLMGLEIYNENIIFPYFTSTHINVIRHDNYLVFIAYIIFTTNVCISILKLIYDFNVKFQIVPHLSLLVHEIINLLLIFFITI